MIAVTPSLFAGWPTDLCWFDDLCLASTPDEAVGLILADKSALIPLPGWEDQAREVLRLLGRDEDHIEWAIATAPRVNEPKPV